MRDDHLRRIAIFVDEPDPGCFYWVMIESVNAAAIWGDLAWSKESFDTWQAAYFAGTVELMRLVPNEVTGPVIWGEDENASPVG